MRIILLAGAVLALAACSGGDQANEANALATDNMLEGDNMGLDSNMDQSGSVNAATAGSAGGATDANTQNLMEKDAKTHDADTNLANGL